MIPNLYLNTLWGMDVRPEVFVAMRLSPAQKQRYKEVIEPAIRDTKWNGVALEPLRVDQSKTGDSILTEIIDGIAHCVLFLADVSVVGYGRERRKGRGIASALRDLLRRTAEVPYRNGNVMYEVGLALAARQPSEILLIRDDTERFLFDVSTIPHMNVDFANAARATAALTEALEGRLRERDFLYDTRVRRAASTLSLDETKVLKMFAHYGPDYVFTASAPKGRLGMHTVIAAGMSRLIDKQIIRVVARGDDGRPGYQWTRLGYVVASSIERILPEIKWQPKEPAPSSDSAHQPVTE